MRTSSGCLREPDAAVPQNTCHGFYDGASNGIYLYNDALTALLGPLTPGTSGTLQNGQSRGVRKQFLAGIGQRERI